MKNLSFLPLLFFIQFARAQYDPAKVNKKAAALYSKALDLARDDKFKEGIDLLKQSVAIDKNYAEAYLSMAGMYGELKNYQDAIDNYEKAKNIDSAYFKDYNLPYSINLAGKGEIVIFEITAVDVFCFFVIID